MHQHQQTSVKGCKLGHQTICLTQLELVGREVRYHPKFLQACTVHGNSNEDFSDALAKLYKNMTVICTSSDWAKLCVLLAFLRKANLPSQIQCGERTTQQCTHKHIHSDTPVTSLGTLYHQFIPFATSLIPFIHTQPYIHRALEYINRWVYIHSKISVCTTVWTTKISVLL